jgi:hypothetical protein
MAARPFGLRQATTKARQSRYRFKPRGQRSSAGVKPRNAFTTKRSPADRRAFDFPAGSSVSPARFFPGRGARRIVRNLLATDLLATMTSDLFYIIRWDRHERKDQPCEMLAHGKMNSCLVRFEDGYTMVTSLRSPCSRGPDQHLDLLTAVRLRMDTMDIGAKFCGRPARW